MQIPDNPSIHLTYCLNVHPGETWEENLQAVKDHALQVRDITAPGRPFGLGLRLGSRAAEELADEKVLEAFKAFLSRHNLYIFTINGFPYGDFHNVPVKENVYHPDWRTRERLEYTNKLAAILSGLMSTSITGSISTVPGSFKAWIKTDSDHVKIIENLMCCTANLAEIYKRDGREIHLGLEPEPGCLLETTDEVIDFFTGEPMKCGRKYLASLAGCSESAAGEMISRHLGICFDTCHMSVQHEDLINSIKRLNKHNIRISKIQISAALKTCFSETGINRLKGFCDPVYLHQVKRHSPSGNILSYNDLPEALEQRGTPCSDKEEWRVHIHVPLYFAGDGELQTTSNELTPDFFREAMGSGCRHFEIETYTFNVLPEKYKSKGIVKSIADEYKWVLKRFGS